MERTDERTFCEPDIVFLIGVPPVRIDILTAIDGVSFAQAWPQRVATRVGNVTTEVLGRDDLSRNKKASGREKD